MGKPRLGAVRSRARAQAGTGPGLAPPNLATVAAGRDEAALLTARGSQPRAGHCDGRRDVLAPEAHGLYPWKALEVDTITLSNRHPEPPAEATQEQRHETVGPPGPPCVCGGGRGMAPGPGVLEPREQTRIFP